MGGREFTIIWHTWPTSCIPYMGACSVPVALVLVNLSLFEAPCTVELEASVAQHSCRFTHSVENWYH